MKEIVVCEEYLNRIRRERDYYKKEYENLVGRIPTIKAEARQEYKDYLACHFKEVLRKYL